MIEFLLICMLGKPTTPCPPPPPPPTEQIVGLPAKMVELTDDKAESEDTPLKPAGKSSQKHVQKLPNAKAKSNDYNRRGIRNH